MDRIVGCYSVSCGVSWEEGVERKMVEVKVKKIGVKENDWRKQVGR